MNASPTKIKYFLKLESVDFHNFLLHKDQVPSLVTGNNSTKQRKYLEDILWRYTKGYIQNKELDNLPKGHSR